MSGATLLLDIELHHTERDQDRDLERVESHVERMMNHPDKHIQSITVHVGNRASSAKIELRPGSWRQRRIDRIASSVAMHLESAGYASEVTDVWWNVKAVSRGDGDGE